jgi:RHS repeat-associated protein
MTIDQHQRIRQYLTSGGTATETVYLNDAATGAMSERVTGGPSTVTTWNGFNWGAAPWSGTLPTAAPTFVDYITVDGQIVAQRTVQYPSASAWGQHNWAAFNWGPPPGSDWGSFNWGSGTWTGPVVTWAYFALDSLGSVAATTGQSGNVTAQLSYDAWGKQRNPNGTAAACGSVSSPTTRGFTGQEQVPQGCLVNLNARLYDPSIGKFMAADTMVPQPYDGQSFNRYSYVANNPLTLIDPTGHGWFSDFWNRAVNGVGSFLGFTPSQSGATGWGNPAASSPQDFPSPEVEPAIVPGTRLPGDQLSWSLRYQSFQSAVSDNRPNIPTAYSANPSGQRTQPNAGTAAGTNNQPNNDPQKPNDPQCRPWQLGPCKSNPKLDPAIKFVCKSNPGLRILGSVAFGAGRGAVVGGYLGFTAGEIFGGEVTLGATGVPGALLGGAVGGTVGGASGLVSGIGLAEACYLAGAYGGS